MRVNQNHVTELSDTSRVLSEQRQKVTFNFNETVKNHLLNKGTRCQIVRFISDFSLKLHVQFFEKCFTVRSSVV